MKIALKLLDSVEDGQDSLVSRLNKMLSNSDPLDIGLQHPLVWNQDQRELHPTIHVVEFIKGSWVKARDCI